MSAITVTGGVYHERASGPIGIKYMDPAVVQPLLSQRTSIR